MKRATGLLVALLAVYFALFTFNSLTRARSFSPDSMNYVDVARRLEEYRTGTATAKDAASFNLMASVAKSLSDEEIQSLGSYVQGLHARPAGTSKAAPGH